MNLQRIVENLGWDSFFVPQVDAPTRIRAIRELMNGEVTAQLLCERGLVTRATEAAKFKARVVVITESLKHLRKNVQRSTQRYLGRFIEEGNRALDQFLRNPSHSSFCILEQCGDFAAKTFEKLRSGSYDEEATQIFLEAIADARVRIPGNVFDIFRLYDAKEVERHQRFITALEREFGIEVHRHEPVAEGVYVYLDATATDSMWEQLRSVPDVLNRVSDKHGYLTLRRGSRADIEWGHFPESYSTWMFVYCPITDASDFKGQGEIIAKGDYKPIDFLGGKSQMPQS